MLAAAAAALGNLGYHHDINRCAIVDAGGMVVVVAVVAVALLVLVLVKMVVVVLIIKAAAAAMMATRPHLILQMAAAPAQPSLAPQVSRRWSHLAPLHPPTCTGQQARDIPCSDALKHRSRAPVVASVRNIIYNAPSARSRLFNEEVPLIFENSPGNCNAWQLTASIDTASPGCHLWDCPPPPPPPPI